MIVQARMGSSRLPGKGLVEVEGATLLEHLVRRLRRAETVVRIVIATTTSPADDRVRDEAERLGVPSFRGSEEDVLSRYCGALPLAGTEVVVRVTADCPLLDPDELDRVVRAFLDARRGPGGGFDYAANRVGKEGAPRGYDVEVFTAQALRRAAEESREPGDREHVTPFLYRVPGLFRVAYFPHPGPDHSRFRLTVDTPEDLRVVEEVIRAVGPDADLAAVTGFLEAHPEIAAINADVRQKSVEGDASLRRARIAGRTLLGRADAGPSIGVGHVARLGALLDAWVEMGGRAVMAGRGIEGAARGRLVACGVEVIDLADDAVGEEGDRRTLSIAAALGACALAVDGYGFSEASIDLFAAALPVLFVDDRAAFRIAADVVVNQNTGFAASRYGDLSPGTAFLVGNAYALLRREFRRAVAARADAVPSRGGRILVTFGGTDPMRLTWPVARALASSLPREAEIAVVGGGSRPPEEGLPAGDARVEHLGEVEDMAALMTGGIDVAVTAAGSTLWELWACGVPLVCVAVAENQRVGSAAVRESGAGVDLGWHADTTPERIAAEARALLLDGARRERMARSARRLIDGKGVYRVIDALLQAIDARRMPRRV